MDYEKKYNEALERAREIKEKIMYSHLSTESCKAVSEYIDTIIPELAESEDERIRKEIINFLRSPFVTENITDEKIAPWLAYLEKQKENPKSADSIPSDCMSDAKCEDRWHKVADSLPDNPREVLCKDEAGNYFIGRYYVGEGWEISNYDDEDKPHHLNPPVSKWIDFPPEKQKEQKEIPIMNSDADLYFDEWNQQKQNPTKRQCFEEGIRYAQRLQKEQKSIIQGVELNDAVYDYVRDHFIAGADFTPEYIKKLMENAFFAGVDYYLLKQESESCEWDTNVEKVIEDVIRVYGKTQGEWVGGYDVDTLIVNLRRAFIKKEQKPAEWSEEDERIRKAILGFLNPDKGGTKYSSNAELVEWSDWLKSRHSSWKPSEEQMKILEKAVAFFKTEWTGTKIKEVLNLESLYEQLKKL